MREVAQRVFEAWPSTNKLLIPRNGGHGSFSGPTDQELASAGVVLTIDQASALKRAMALHFGNNAALLGASVDCLVRAISNTEPAFPNGSIQ